MSLTLTRRDLARLITRIENGERDAQHTLNALYPQTGRARVIGITGAPGSGKSTLVSEMARALRNLPGNPQVAIVAVDPSSPFSGGAILGDRIRMRDLHGDSGIFIRSMASRGALGGIAAATADVVSALDATGFEIILIETVGAGQLEVDVARIAQTIIVVEAPGAGDEVQAVKAGILEIADVIAVNKADRDGVAQTVNALQSALDLTPMNGHHTGHAAPSEDSENAPHPVSGWRPPIVKVSALNHEGIDELLAAVDLHRAYLKSTGDGDRRYRQRIELDIQARLRELLLKTVMSRISHDDYQTMLTAVGQREMHPAEAARRLLDTLNL